jgi:microsomal prostaglandin-E synthase 1
MPTTTLPPAFVPYALTATLLCLNLLVLWNLSGAARGKSKTTPNAEDTGTVAKGARLTPEDPESVARMLRVYNNAEANIVPFLILGLIYVLLGAPSGVAWILFGGFAVARVLHAIVYAAGKQPWRTIFYVLGQLFTLAVVVQVVRGALAMV